MEIRTIVADDERPAREEIRYLLRSVDDVTLVGEADNGVEAFHLIESEQPDLALLDIQMPGLDGFQLVREIRNLERFPHIIFITAFDHYAIQAFEVSAVDYLLKPVELERLVQAIDRVRPLLEKRTDLDEKLSEFLATLPSHGRHLTKVPVRRRKHLHLIDVQDIVYGYVKDGVVFIATRDVQDLVSYRTLDEFASELDPEVFHRVHRSYLANINYICEIIPLASGNYELLMDDSAATRIPLSRQHARELRRIYKW
ncbi:MAG: LytR/AlgR family response regulator transcription factor [Candidatus Krumholzibacteriia bacterium]